MKLITKSGWIIPAPASAAYFKSSKIDVSKYDLFRKVAKDLPLEAQIRLEWIIFYETVGGRDASATARYFKISRKTFHKWLLVFKNSRQDVKSLCSRSTTPVTKRVWTVTPVQEKRIKELRLSHMKYGKAKLRVLYSQMYGENITTWKIERVIRRLELYPNKKTREKKLRIKKIRQYQRKVRIKDFKKEPTLGFLWHFDTVEVWWYGQRRYIFTALEDLAKIAYARVYSSKVSGNAEDFLYRLLYITNNQVLNSHQDNGSEFEKHFADACSKLNITQVFSRPHTPKDNPCLERFNRTVQDEWLSMSESGLDNIKEANKDLTEWLVEYNFNRPHHSLDLKSPIVYAQENFKVSPMWSASTIP